MKGMQLKGDAISNKEDRDGVAPGLKRPVLGVGAQVAFRRNAQSGSRRKKGGRKKEWP